MKPVFHSPINLIVTIIDQIGSTIDLSQGIKKTGESILPNWNSVIPKWHISPWPNMDSHKERILPILSQTYGESAAEQWFQRWRIFFMACAELFGHADGQEWYVSHYLFGRAVDHSEGKA